MKYITIFRFSNLIFIDRTAYGFYNRENSFVPLDATLFHGTAWGIIGSCGDMAECIYKPGLQLSKTRKKILVDIGHLMSEVYPYRDCHDCDQLSQFYPAEDDLWDRVIEEVKNPSPI